MIATVHNHSTWSDGNPTFDDIYEYAQGAGVDILGLSDHFCIYPDGKSPDWALHPNKINEYLEDVLSYRGKSNIEIRVGLEFDWFENHHSVITPYVESIPLDYRIGAVHHVESQQFDMDMSYWTSKSEEERDQVYLKYWALVQEMAESDLFDIAAHIDLPKKLGFYPTHRVDSAIEAALDAIAVHNLVVELNTAAFSNTCSEGYPSLELLKKCQQRELSVTLSSDSHSNEHVLREFERGLAHLREVGFTHITRSRERERWFEPLSNALKNTG